MDGEIVQHIEYVPFGEVFIEERNNTWNTPYLFNAKELDEETGLYYYGARYYDARTSVWLSTDPMQEKYPNISTYAYTNNNPVKYVDPNGMDWWSTNDMELISQFLNSVGKNAKNYDFRGWEHSKTNIDNSMRLSYDDDAGKFYMTDENGRTTTFDANLKPVSLTGEGYPGAFVYEYESGRGWLYTLSYNATEFNDISSFLAAFIAPFDPNEYFDGTNKWDVDTSGRITGVNNIQEVGKSKGGKSLAKLFIKGFGEVGKDSFHRVLKKNILRASKGYESKVGSNPDVTVEKGKIVLKGTGGGHKGKTHETGLNANDYLE